MRILIAPDKFKGSLSGDEAAEAIANGFRRVWVDAVVDVMPIADGGEGTAETICRVRGGRWITVEATGPMGERISARYPWVEQEKLAVIEMSEASGLWRVEPERRDPLRATTRGTGELIRDAAGRGAKRIIVGLGGSATNDGGMGMAAALGYQFLTSDGEEIEPIPLNLLALTRIELPEELDLPEIIAACDVQNPLLGPRGATETYGRQKGADEKMLKVLELALENLAQVTTEDLGCDFKDTPGAGAAGGTAFGLLTFCGASLQPGFEVVAKELGLERAIAGSDLVATGEGSLDSQTMEGKGPAGVAMLARKHGKPVIAFAGRIANDSRLETVFDATFQLDGAATLAESMREAKTLLEHAAERAARQFQTVGAWKKAAQSNPSI